MYCIEDIFGKISAFRGDIICLGDFNVDLEKPFFYTNKCRRIIEHIELKQIIRDYIRITKISGTSIDYVLTNNKNINHVVHLTPKISDHTVILGQNRE